MGEPHNVFFKASHIPLVKGSHMAKPASMQAGSTFLPQGRQPGEALKTDPVRRAAQFLEVESTGQ